MKRSEAVLLVLAVFAGLAIRLYFFTGMIASDDLTHARNAAWMFLPVSERPVADMSMGSVPVRRLGVNLPLYLSMRAFGVHEWSLALGPLLFSVAGIGAAYGLLRTLAGRSAGLLAAWVWACLPADVYTATVWLQDNIFATVFALFLLCLAAAERWEKRRYLWALAAGLALGYLEYVKESAYLCFLPLGVWAAYSSWRARRFQWTIVHVFLGFLVVQVLAGWYFWSQGGSPLVFWRETYARYTEVVLRREPPFPFPQNLQIAARYLTQQWVFGYAVVLFPLLALVAALGRRTPLRGLLLMLFVLQVYILQEALKLGSWTQRYILQCSVLFIVFMVLGLRTLLSRLPARWDRYATVLASGAIVLATGTALNKDWQQHGRWRAAVVRQAFAYLDACAAADDTIHVDLNRRILYTRNALELLAGFQQFKGGFEDISVAYDATSGWVVLTHLENQRPPLRPEAAFRGVAPRWLEVFHARNNSGQYYARVYKILPEMPPSAVRVIDNPQLPAAPPDISQFPMQALRCSGAPADFKSTWQGASERVDIGAIDGGLRCDITGSKEDTQRQYGGVKLDVAGMAALRFHLTLINPENVEVVYIDAYDSQRAARLRWQWRLTRTQRERGFDGPVTFIPGHPAGAFQFSGQLAPEAIRSIHVFLRIVPGTQAGFELRAPEVAPVAAAPQPPASQGAASPARRPAQPSAELNALAESGT